MSRVVIGDVVSGKYRVERILAESRGARVFAARHLELDLWVALKISSLSPAAQSLASERFRGAARAAARLQSSHVCRVLDIGLHDDDAFMVLEYLEGCHLAAELTARGRLPFHEVFDCILQACDVLSEAHALGFVHGDVKPANMFWAALPDGSRHIKMLGFGDLRLDRDQGGRSSDPHSASVVGAAVTASVINTPMYMAPEQLEGTACDERTDIWALGVVMYELITGRPPFQGSSFPSLVSAVLTLPPQPIAALSGAAPAGVDAVLMRALSKRPEQRYGSIAELLAALVPLAPPAPALTASGASGNSAVRLSHASRVRTLAATGQGAAPMDQRVTRGSGRRYGVSLAALGLLVLLAFALFKWRQLSVRPVAGTLPSGSLTATTDSAPPVLMVRPAAHTQGAAALSPEPEAAPPAGVAPPAELPRHETRDRTHGGRTNSKRIADKRASDVQPVPVMDAPPAPQPTDAADVSDFGGRR